MEFMDTRLPMNFWDKVRPCPATGCWLWTASRMRTGYGSFGGGPGSRRGTVSAHRHGYQALMGPVPEGLELDHLCRVRHCVNPAHLEPVTRKENATRGAAGEVNAARQRALTHCKHGHAFDEANTLVTAHGYRVCRACARARVLAGRSRLNGGDANV